MTIDKTINPVKENLVENFCKLGIGKDNLNRIEKAKNIKEKNDKIYFKTKTFCSLKTTDWKKTFAVYFSDIWFAASMCKCKQRNKKKAQKFEQTLRK